MSTLDTRSLLKCSKAVITPWAHPPSINQLFSRRASNNYRFVPPSSAKFKAVLNLSTRHQVLDYHRFRCDRLSGCVAIGMKVAQQTVLRYWHSYTSIRFSGGPERVYLASTPWAMLFSRPHRTLLLATRAEHSKGVDEHPLQSEYIQSTLVSKGVKIPGLL